VPDSSYQLFGVKLLGVSSDTLHKAILTVVFAIGILALRTILEWIVRRGTRKRPRERRTFWMRQAINLFTAAVFILVLMSVWFDDPSHLATGIGLVSAGLAFALQKVITSLAGYFVIIRSRVFTLGERITMGGVRGDVIALGFLKTTLMEMGDPSGEPATVWVRGRQYTGRIVTVTNDKIFEEPIFNSTRAFPFLWEEIQIPITYAADRARAEAIVLASAERATLDIQREAQPHRVRMNEEFNLDLESVKPRVFMRITDNWLELSLRFLARDRETRELKDQVTRDILRGFDEAGIGIASTTIDIVAFPPVRRAPRTREAGDGGDSDGVRQRDGAPR
jgi:small-conductance mechanosensitive channel